MTGRQIRYHNIPDIKKMQYRIESQETYLFDTCKYAIADDKINIILSRSSLVWVSLCCCARLHPGVMLKIAMV